MTTGEEQVILGEIEAFAIAWSKGDAKEVASFYAADATRVGAFGDIQHGTAEIEAAYDNLLHGTMPGAKLKQERGTVRLLSTRFAIWQGAMEITPLNGLPLKGYVVQVMKKVGGRWLVLEAHPKFFPPRPATK